MKNIIFFIVLMILFPCSILSQENNDSLEAAAIDIGKSLLNENTVEEKQILSANEIIKKTRLNYLARGKNIKTSDYHVFSKTVFNSHFIDNPVDFFTDYSGKDYNILGADETELFEYHKKPVTHDEKKIIIESNRQTAILDKTYSGYFYPDLFDEEVSLVNETLPGPLAHDCFENYTYKLISTDSSQGKKIYKISLKEKHKYIPSFNGLLFIEDSTFALKQATIKTNLAINIPLVKEISINNSYASYLDPVTNQVYNFPSSTDINTIASFAGVIKLKISSRSESKNYSINNNQKGVNYNDFEIVVKPDARKKTKEFWKENGLKLSDTIFSKEDEKMFEEKVKPSSVKFTGTGLKFGNNLTWNFLYFYTFNRIDGNHLELNTTYERNFKRFILNSQLIYGTADQEFKYSFNLKLFPTKKLDFLIKADVFSNLEPLFKKLSWINYIENAISTLVTKKDRTNYFKGVGYRLGVDYRISKVFTLGTDIYQSKQTSVSNNTNFSFAKKNENYSINPQINDALTRKISFNLSVDLNRYRMIDWGDGDVSRIRLSILPVLEFKYSYSDRKVLKSTYDFKEYHVKVTGSVTLSSLFKIIYKTGATLKYGAVPYQELNAIDVKFLGLPNDVSMIVPDYGEFLGDRIVFVNLENEFGKIFPFNIPILSSITLLGDLCFGKTWISDANRNLSPDKGIKTTQGFYAEIGFGLTRILEIGTLRYSWRLNNFKEGSDSFLFFDVGIRY